MAIFTVPDELPVVFSGPRRPNVPLGISLCVLLGLLEAYWLAAILYCVYTTWFTGRKWRATTQVDGLPVQMSPMNPAERRWCEDCGIHKGNRTYHCKQLGVCLPFYDHYCAFWVGAVWGYNMKAYLVFYVFLLAHQLACLAVGAWVLDKHNPLHTTNWPASAVSVAGINLIYTLGPIKNYRTNLAFYNRLQEETKAPVRIFWLDDGLFEWETADASSSPFNLGIKNNLRFVTGPWWSFPLFWTKSPVQDACRLEYYEMRPLKATEGHPSSLPQFVGDFSATFDYLCS